MAWLALGRSYSAVKPATSLVADSPIAANVPMTRCATCFHTSPNASLLEDHISLARL